jgi:hypothetical protein
MKLASLRRPPAARAPVTLRSLATGTIASLVTAATSAAVSRMLGRSAVAPINAASHVARGPVALRRDRVSVEHTLLGMGVHWAASVALGSVYESMVSRGAKPTIASAVGRGVLTAGSAWAIDAWLLPRRLESGFQRQMPSKAVLAVYVALAVALPAREIYKNRHLRRVAR